MSDPAEKLVEKARELSDLRDEKNDLEEQLKEVNKKKAVLEIFTIPDMMADLAIDKMTIQGVGTLYTQAGVYAHIKVEDHVRAHTWFRENGHGALVKESVNHNSLKGWVKEQFAEGKEVPDYFNAKPTTTARIRRN